MKNGECLININKEELVFLLSLVTGHLNKAEDNYQEIRAVIDISVTVKYQAKLVYCDYK